ncbi:M1 family metallopeptidase [Candidatus Nanopelagicales bacterium]|nr:M1 family metallopeptidase [Candidatus Nanopelagicales bacterium]
MAQRRRVVGWLAASVPAVITVSLISLPVTHAAPTAPEAKNGVGAPIGTDPYLSPSGNGGYDVKRYDLKFKYSPSSHGIAAARVLVKAKSLQQLDRFSLDAGMGLNIASVRVAGHEAKFRHKGGKLAVRGFPAIPADTAFTTKVRYAGKPQPLVDSSGRGRFGWLRTPNGVVTYSEPNGTSTWIPSNDIFYDKAKWRIDATVPSGLMAVSTGKLTKKTQNQESVRTVWKMSTPIQNYAQVVAIDRFAFSRKPIAGVRSFVAVSKDAPVNVRNMLKRTKRAMKWTTAKLGPYPFKDTGAIVVFGGNSALETAGRPTYSGDLYYAHQDTVLHEIAHQWFGNRLTATNARDMWLHEGFATYLENVAASERKGRNLDDVVHTQYVQDGWGSGRHGQFDSVPLADPTPRYLLNSTPYFRGQAAVHALRAELGESEFWAALRAIASVPNGTTTDADAVISDLEKVTGRSLAAWSATWLYSTGYQALPVAPSHPAVVRQMADGILDAAGDWSHKRKTSAQVGLERAVRSYSPMNQLVIEKTRSSGSGKKRRVFVDFHTKTSPLYPRRYASCFVFKPRATQTLLGAWAGVEFSDDYSANTFTTAACPTR